MEKVHILLLVIMFWSRDLQALPPDLQANVTDQPPEPEHELFLVYGRVIQGQPGVIRGMDMNVTVPDEYMIPIQNLMFPCALDFHAESKFIYFAESTSIGRQKIDGTERDTILKKGIHKVEGIAVDWMADNLYWTDDRSKTINVARLENASQTRKTLIKGKMTHPWAIVVDPLHGYMYWTDWEESPKEGKRGRIERAWMDGSNRKVFLTSETVLWPWGLSLDVNQGILYWVDAYYERIEMVYLNNPSEHKTVYKGEELKHPFGLCHYKHFLFWTERDSGSIYKLDTITNTVTLLRQETPRIYEIRMYDAEQQQGSNACRVNNGGCSSLCLATPGGRQCACGEDELLDQHDKVSCKKGDLQANVNEQHPDLQANVTDQPPEPEHELFLVYSRVIKGQPGVIRGMDMNVTVPDEYMIPIKNLMNPRALDFHAESKFIYFADATSLIGRQKIDGTERDTILNKGIHKVTGIAVDWMAANLYWTDDGPKKTISVARLEKALQTRKTLIEGKMTHPWAIVVDPLHG